MLRDFHIKERARLQLRGEFSMRSITRIWACRRRHSVRPVSAWSRRRARSGRSSLARA